MFIFVSIKKLVQMFWWLIAAIVLYIFYQSIGLNMFFLLVIGLLALRFVPVLVLPILIIALGVHFSGGFSFIADLIVWGFWGLVSLPICFGFSESIRTTIEQKKQVNK
ncbi:TPA: hypothetical protein VCJ25_001287 [Streptococcus pyogenes]|nr:hypothetical protein [Streptococcus pyogenes]